MLLALAKDDGKGVGWGVGGVEGRGLRGKGCGGREVEGIVEKEMWRQGSGGNSGKGIWRQGSGGNCGEMDVGGFEGRGQRGRDAETGKWREL